MVFWSHLHIFDPMCVLLFSCMYFRHVTNEVFIHHVYHAHYIYIYSPHVLRTCMQPKKSPHMHTTQKVTSHARSHGNTRAQTRYIPNKDHSYNAQRCLSVSQSVLIRVCASPARKAVSASARCIWPISLCRIYVCVVYKCVYMNACILASYIYT
jgi:hypothetical protein